MTVTARADRRALAGGPSDGGAGPDGDEARTDSPGSRRPATVRRLALHALLAFVALTAMAIALHSTFPAISDDGSVLAQAALLRDGETGTDLPLPAADPEGAFPPLENSTTADGRAYPYAKHLALPAAVAAMTTVFGPVGAVLTSAWTVWLAALAAATLAWRLDRRLAPAALWATAFLTPLVFDANLVVSTGAAAAALGFLVAAVLALRDRPAWWRLLPIAAMAFLVPLWRTEGLFGVAAVALVATAEPVVRALRDRRLVVPTVQRIVAGVVAGVAGLAAYALDVTVSARTIGSSSSSFVPSSEDYDPIAGRVSAVWKSLLRPSHDVPTTNTLVVLAVLALLVVAVVLSRRRAAPGAVVGVTVAAGAASLALVVAPVGLVTGLLPAVPLLFAGLLLLRREDLARPVVQAAVAVSVVAAAAVVATSYAEGGGAEWGGRYYHLLLPLLVPPALLGLRTARDRLPSRDATIATVAVLVVALAPSVLALRSIADLHRGAERTVEVVLAGVEDARAAGESEPGGPAGDGGDVVVVSARPTFGRFAWDQLGGIRLLTVADPERLREALDGVSGTEVERVVVLAQDDEEPTGDTLAGWKVTDRELVGGWQITRMERSAPSG